MDDPRSIYVTGLRNAHALETQALEMIERQLDSLEHYHEVRARLQQHHQETEQQQKRLRAILDRHDESTSMLKEMSQSFMGNMAALGHAMASDAILKNTMANFAFENFEIATYKSLIVMARAAGDQPAVSDLTQTLQEEQAMARWIDERVEQITQTYISREERGQQAAS